MAGVPAMRIPGERAGTWIYHNGDGYYYYHKRELVAQYSYRCVRDGCTGRATSDRNEARTNLVMVVPHVIECIPDPDRGRSMELRRAVEEACMRVGTRSMMTTIRQEVAR